MTSGVLRESSASRSWFSATEPPTSAPGGSAERSRSIVAPVALEDGSVFGHDLHERLAAGAGDGGHDLRDAGVGLGDDGDARGVALGGHDLHGAGRALAEGLLDLVVAGA